MHLSSHTNTNTHTHTHTHNKINNSKAQAHKHTQKKPRHKYYHYNQLNFGIWQVLKIYVDGRFKKDWVVCCHIFAPSRNFKYDFIPFTSCQWASTWKLRTGHITLSAVPSKTEQRILCAPPPKTHTHAHQIYMVLTFLSNVIYLQVAFLRRVNILFHV